MNNVGSLIGKALTPVTYAFVSVAIWNAAGSWALLAFVFAWAAFSYTVIRPFAKRWLQKHTPTCPGCERPWKSSSPLMSGATESSVRELGEKLREMELRV